MADDFSLEARQARLAKNQAVFRSVNEKVEELARKQGVADEPISFVCECAAPECVERIELTHREYEAIREDPTRFVVLPGHIFPEVETVVDERDRYAVVEKFGAGGEVVAAEATEDQ